MKPGGDWIKPVEGILTSPFSARVNPVTGRNEFHNGLDIACEMGTPVKAVADGIVTDTGVSATYGNYLKYSVDGGYSIFYAHLSEVIVKRGERLKAGQVAAKSGSTGRSTGPHLHLTVYADGAEGAEDAEVDPMQFFDYAP